MVFAWLLLFVALGGLRGGRGLQEVDVFPSRGGDIRDFTVAARWVYVVTGDYLYQLNLSLGLLHSLTQREEYIGSSVFGRFNRTLEGGASTFSVNTLAPLVERNLLFTCGALNSGYCETLNLTDITQIISGEHFELSPSVPKGISVGFVVDVNGKSYILAAAEGMNDTGFGDFPKKSRIRLHNTHDSQFGGLLSAVDGTDSPEIVARARGVQFVDGFQIKSTILIFSNLNYDAPKVRLLWFASKTSKKETLRSLRGATLVCCEGGKARQRLVSSSVIPGDQPVLWAGIFSDHDVTITELAVYDVSPPTDAVTYTDPDFGFKQESWKGDGPIRLRPLRVLLKHRFMTSVLAVKLNNWLIVFIGTGDGQLLKLTVDATLQAQCLSVIWKAPDDRRVFPKMHLDPVGRKHVFLAVRDKLMRVPVSQCVQHSSLQSCWNARDPYCGWCGALRRCSFEDECPSSLWLSVPDDPSQRQMLSHSFQEDAEGKITLVVFTHLKRGGAPANFSCRFDSSVGVLGGLGYKYPECTCLLPPVIGLRVSVTVSLGEVDVTEELNLLNCSGITGAPTPLLCSQCLAAGCGWSHGACTWTRSGALNMSICQGLQTGVDSLPEIFNITPSEMSFYGENNAVLTGRNLGHVIGVRLQGHLDCSAKEAPVRLNTGARLTFHIPAGDKGRVEVCLLLPDGGCHGNASLTYRSAPVCASISPDSTWASGKRRMNITVSNLKFVNEVIHSHTDERVTFSESSDQSLQFESLPADRDAFSSTVTLRVANHTLACPTAIRYLPDPQFTDFISAPAADHMRLTIEKKSDELQMAPEDLRVKGVQGGEDLDCVITTIERSSGTDFITCVIQSTSDAAVTAVKIRYGGQTKVLTHFDYLKLLLLLLVVPLIVGTGVGVYCWQKRSLTARMNHLIEVLEMDIRNDIRQGFVDMQTEDSDLIENVGAIPFLDYKHFAAKIFFPEGGSLMTACLKDISQDPRKMEKQDDGCGRLAQLLREPLFLTSMVHTLEEQKSFTIQHKCTVASVLTVALHRDLGYLTEVMEQLLRAAMEQPGNNQHKMVLRRTQSIVEKVLTNWMSVCLYGFLRESAGQHLYFLVSALTQQIAKGPVDSVTEKALYTLSEDWLLWQAQDFTAVKLQAVFVVGGDGQLSEPLEVEALSCDTVDQVKLKILAVFKAKFGFAYNIPLRDIRLELEKGPGVFVALEEVDRSSEVIGEVTMLNTLRHYKVPAKVTVKVLSTGCHPPLVSQSSLKDDQDFSVKYFHLIDPDVCEDQGMNPERKKLKLKEVHLTKLLSTKVAVHSYVVNLFRGIWGVGPGKAPPAIKHFFDFLDGQAARMKITDPEVLHIWKTNSLPLRFWVNILKNPQFVFDMDKSDHLDGCLSVIAQAFMDSFSLTDTKLGKHAPTNKLLYAKDIPQFKQEVKAYYNCVREQQPITTAEFKDFLLEESRKHDNEFNEAAALRELYKFIHQYFTEIEQKLEHSGAPAELKEQLKQVKNQFDGQKSCSWD
ncbi:plexin-C1 isoform X2 [Gadus chalcogrammus]|uniref:plexin-C1 isoform X2 n=1 Tax=Gadus chalcogrammus TaxID=1042646 RepID=UPI0024C3BA7D|nr:plexin-C1 isoform X2 [Gadus chalcogrammus]